MARVTMRLRVKQVDHYDATRVTVRARGEGTTELVAFLWPNTTTVPDVGTVVRVIVDTPAGD
jgi:hypothetical protein